MYIHSVKAINYKSLSSYDNEIILEPQITSIIGKNESGKSNVIEAISHIKILGDMSAAFNAENSNRNNETTAPIAFEIVLKPSAEDISFGITSDSKVVITKDSHITTGGLYDYYQSNLMADVTALLSAMGNNPFKLSNQDLTNFRTYVETLKAVNNLHLKRMEALFPVFESWFPRADAANVEEIKALYEIIKGKWLLIKERIPTVFYRNSNKVLKSSYTLDEVQKELANPNSYPNSLLHALVQIIGIPNSDFIKAVQTGNAGSKTTIRDRIRRSIDSKINAEFHKFYRAEEVYLSATMDANVVTFSVRTDDGEALNFSERSNGLRWYLNTFIDSLWCGVSRSNVVYLFDEPGTSLHVNAQKELINLFKDLSSKGNQVVYTTHSPYMLDTKDDGIYRIRAIDKDNSGNTHVYKTAYDSRLSPDSKEDTLTPIANAIGMNFYDTFGPAKDKLNIIIEGVSDYIYIHCMAKFLGYDLSKYSLIPSVGASNCVNICTILHGWGCPFFALFDYDNAGVNSGGEILRKEFLFELNNNYCYVIPVTEDDILNKTYVSNPCMIEDVVTSPELLCFEEQFPDAKNVGKTLKAKLFSTAIGNGEYIPGEECKKNFKELIDRLLVNYN